MRELENGKVQATQAIGNREEYDRKEELANEMGVTQEEDNDKLKAMVLA